MHTKKTNIILFSILFNIGINFTTWAMFKNFKIPKYKGPSNFSKVHAQDSFKNVQDTFNPLTHDINPIDFLSMENIGADIQSVMDEVLPQDFLASLFPSLLSSTTEKIINLDTIGKFTEKLKDLSDEQKKSFLAKVVEKGKNLAQTTGQFVKEHKVAIGAIGGITAGAYAYLLYEKKRDLVRKEELRKERKDFTRNAKNTQKNLNELKVSTQKLADQSKKVEGSFDALSNNYKKITKKLDQVHDTIKKEGYNILETVEKNSAAAHKISVMTTQSNTLAQRYVQGTQKSESVTEETKSAIEETKKKLKKIGVLNNKGCNNTILDLYKDELLLKKASEALKNIARA